MCVSHTCCGELLSPIDKDVPFVSATSEEKEPIRLDGMVFAQAVSGEAISGAKEPGFSSFLVAAATHFSWEAQVAAGRLPSR